MSSKPDDSPHEIFREWKISPTANPNFKPDVWARIHARQRASWAAYARRHLVSFSAAAVVTLLASSWAGNMASRARIDAARDKMVVSYLVGLDPRAQANLKP